MLIFAMFPKEASQEVVNGKKHNIFLTHGANKELHG